MDSCIAKLAKFALLLMTLLSCTIYNTSSKEFYITTATSDPCPSEPCLTLSQFAANISIYLDTSTTLTFQSGNHSLDSELLVANIIIFELLTISNLTSLPCRDTNVIIAQSTRFHLINVSKVNIRGIVFLAFGGNKVESVNQLTIENSTFTGQKRQSNGTALELVATTATIVKCLFTENTNGSYRKVPYYPYLWVGGAIIATDSNILIDGSTFEGNRAEAGGAIFGDLCSNMTIMNSTFIKNHATCYRSDGCTGSYINTNGGALFIIGGCRGSKLNIAGSNFSNNKAASTGGAFTALYVSQITIEIKECQFINNTAYEGGAIVYELANGIHNMTIERSLFKSNSAGLNGGAMFVRLSTVIIIETIFSNNGGKGAGGGIYVNGGQQLMISASEFSENAQPGGGGAALWAQMVKSVTITGTNFSSNAIRVVNCSLPQHFALGVLTLFECSAVFDDTSFFQNKGSLSLIFSNITFKGHTTFFSNHYSICSEGGAITAYQSNVVIDGICIMMNNHASSGGAMRLSESKVFVYGNTIVANNTANETGGGSYLYHSKLSCEVGSILELTGNDAMEKGGGLHAISSTITLNRFKGPGSIVTFVENIAKMGGGLCFEMDSKLYILDRIGDKHKPYPSTLRFIQNMADYGGAVYVADFGICSEISVSKECFLQVVATFFQGRFIGEVALNFTENYAQKSGSNLFGGLLDRCTVTPLANSYTVINGVDYLTNISNTNSLDSVSSEAVGLCFCTSGHKNCSLQAPTISVMKGHNFNISLVAIDQVSHSIKASVRSYLFTKLGGLGENQLNQSTGDTCTNLTYSVYSPNSYEKLILYADGPCKDAPKSSKTILIKFTPCQCPIGFQPKDEENYTNCECECDSRLHPYITDCDYQTSTLKRERNFWITYINISANNFSSGFLIYPNCPLDYCKPPTPAISLQFRTQNDSDAQCANNRSGVLCGICPPDFSLSLGSSHCIQCSSTWHRVLASILIASILAGIALVILLLMLNMTVAVGTLNGIIFYANIVGATSSTLFPYSTQNFLTVFIAWLNLDIGFDTCFFKGMNAYWKTLLQLAFPTYIIVLVIVIIIISECSTRFAQLISKRNPVATLTTLILLSYTKLLRVIIASLSFAILNYPDGSHKIVWLPDATVDYLKGKHIILFTVAILILVTGIVFTFVLFSWQWLLQYQHVALFKWVRYHKLRLFLEPYHAPYNFKYRYWTGLLLLVRSFLYIVISVVNVSNNPSVNTLAIGISMLFLLAMVLNTYHGVTGQLYRNSIVDLIELVCYMNIALFSIVKLYALGSENEKTQIVVAYISGSITFALFVSIFAYHIFTECIAKSKHWKQRRTTRKRYDTVLSESTVTVDSRDSDLPTTKPTFSDINGPSDGERTATAVVESEYKGGSTKDGNQLRQKSKKRQLKEMPFDSTSQNESINSTVPLLNEDELLFQTMDTGR